MNFYLSELILRAAFKAGMRDTEGLRRAFVADEGGAMTRLQVRGKFMSDYVLTSCNVAHMEPQRRDVNILTKSPLLLAFS